MAAVIGIAVFGPGVFCAVAGLTGGNDFPAGLVQLPVELLGGILGGFEGGSGSRAREEVANG